MSLNNYIKIILIDFSVDNCQYINKLFLDYPNIIFDYESDFNQIDSINFNFYNICIYNINNNYNFDFFNEDKTIFVAFNDNLEYNQNEDTIKYIMSLGFDMYVNNMFDNEIIKHMLAIYKLVCQKQVTN